MDPLIWTYQSLFLTLAVDDPFRMCAVNIIKSIVFKTEEYLQELMKLSERHAFQLKFNIVVNTRFYHCVLSYLIIAIT